jgi:ubiquinol-cytochrome c reductase iron-sulfur subunit
MSTQSPAVPESGDQTADPSRRTWLALTTGAGAAAGVAAATPFLLTFQPSERAKAAGAAVEVDIADLKAGEFKTVEWRGKPVWILRRTPAMIESLKKTDDKVVDPNSDKYYQIKTPDYAKNEHRSIKPEYLVMVGICPHLGCSPSERPNPGPQPNLPDDWVGGYLCPCHGSTFDLAGRVFKNKPSPANMDIPPHMYLSDTKLLIGEDKKA